MVGTYGGRGRRPHPDLLWLPLPSPCDSRPLCPQTDPQSKLSADDLLESETGYSSDRGGVPRPHPSSPHVQVGPGPGVTHDLCVSSLASRVSLVGVDTVGVPRTYELSRRRAVAVVPVRAPAATLYSEKRLV